MQNKTRSVSAACECGWHETYGCDADDETLVEHHHGHDVRGSHPFAGTITEFHAEPKPYRRGK